MPRHGNSYKLIADVPGEMGVVPVKIDTMPAITIIVHPVCIFEPLTVFQRSARIMLDEEHGAVFGFNPTRHEDQGLRAIELIHACTSRALRLWWLKGGHLRYADCLESEDQADQHDAGAAASRTGAWYGFLSIIAKLTLIASRCNPLSWSCGRLAFGQEWSAE